MDLIIILRCHSESNGILNLLIGIIGVLVPLILGIVSERRNKANIKIEQQKHRPLLHIGYRDSERRLTVFMKNKGSGPLLIKNYYLEKIDEPNIGKKERGIFDILPPIAPDRTYNNYTGNQNNTVISSGKLVNLFELGGEVNDKVYQEIKKDVRKALSHYKIVVEYKDVYDIDMPRYERSLIWFGRHYIPSAVKK